MSGSLMPPAKSLFGPPKESPIDPTWITAASNVLGSAMKSGGGPDTSRAESGGYVQFGDSPFTVTTGSGDASSALAGGSSHVLWALVAVAIGALAWKLTKKS